MSLSLHPSDAHTAIQNEPSTTPAPQDSMESIAQAIKRSGLSVPAIFALRTVRPLGWLGAQMLWVAAPLLQGLLVGRGGRDLYLSRLALLLEQEGSLERLAEQLETQSRNAG